MKKNVIISLFLFFTVTNSLVAQIAPKYSNEFLSLGVGAGPIALGGAVIASINDATSSYWNPAGLVSIKDNLQIALMHNEQFAGIGKQDYGAISFRLRDESVVALSVIRYGVDDIPNTLNLYQNGQIDYSQITGFSSVDYAFIGSYARKTPIEGLTLGANLKVVRRIIGDFANSWGFGIDAGAQYKIKKWKFALMLRDVTTTFNVWTYTFTDAQKQILLNNNNQLPSNNLELTLPKLIFGAAHKWQFFNNKFSVMPEFDFDITTDGQRNVLISSRYVNLDPKIGLELGYNNFVFLRGGAYNFQYVQQIDGSAQLSMSPTVGVGLKLNNIAVDYALANGGLSTALPYSNVISLKLYINKK